MHIFRVLKYYTSVGVTDDMGQLKQQSVNSVRITNRVIILLLTPSMGDDHAIDNIFHMQQYHHCNFVYGKNEFNLQYL